VVPEDVKAVAVAALAHRITVKPELWLRDIDGTSVVNDVLAATATPPTVRPT
jgi:MoxR-like ATPase